jgi:hypothetical protein
MRSILDFVCFWIWDSGAFFRKKELDSDRQGDRDSWTKCNASSAITSLHGQKSPRQSYRGNRHVLSYNRYTYNRLQADPNFHGTRAFNQF